MKHLDVLLLYEHVDRELDVLCAIKYYLESQFSLKVEIYHHPLAELQFDFGQILPRLVALPHCYSSYIPYVLDWPDAIYVSLMWEQILYSGNMKSKLPKGNFGLNHVLHHAWSNETAKLLADIGVPLNHIIKNGNPTYALYREPYRQYYERKDELANDIGLNPNKRWLFFPENYNWAFYNDEQLGWFIESERDADKIYGMQQFCQQSLESVVQWFGELALTNNVEIIVRPRPATPSDLFRQRLENILPNIPGCLHITKAKTIREWILCSDVIVSSYSTSLIEAAVAGKPVYMLEPIPIPDALQMDWQKYAPRIRSSAQLAEAVKNVTKDHDRRLQRWATARMLSNQDPIFNLAKLLADYAKGNLQPPPLPPKTALSLPKALGLSNSLLYEYHRILRHWQRLRRRWTKSKLQPSFTYEKDIISDSDLRLMQRNWRALLEGKGGQ